MAQRNVKMNFPHLPLWYESSAMVRAQTCRARQARSTEKIASRLDQDRDKGNWFCSAATPEPWRESHSSVNGQLYTANLGDGANSCRGDFRQYLKWRETGPVGRNFGPRWALSTLLRTIIFFPVIKGAAYYRFAVLWAWRDNLKLESIKINWRYSQPIGQNHSFFFFVRSGLTKSTTCAVTLTLTSVPKTDNSKNYFDSFWVWQLISNLWC